MANTKPGVKCCAAPVAVGLALSLLVWGCAGPQGGSHQRGAPELALPAGPIDERLARSHRGDTLKAKIAVLEFSTPAEVNLRLHEILITSLVQTGRVDVLEPAPLAQLTAEQKLSLEKLLGFGGGVAHTSLVDSKTVSRLGELLGARVIVFGAVSSATRDKVDMFAYDLVRFKVTVDVRAVDTASGRIFLSESSTGVVEAKVYTTAKGVVIAGAENLESGYADAARQALDAIAVKIGAHYPLVGNALRVRDGSVHIRPGDFAISADAR
jgi:curli biogenesis system outer membrane secretion channel CsgG